MKKETTLAQRYMSKLAKLIFDIGNIVPSRKPTQNRLELCGNSNRQIKILSSSCLVKEHNHPYFSAKSIIIVLCLYILLSLGYWMLLQPFLNGYSIHQAYIDNMLSVHSSFAYLWSYLSSEWLTLSQIVILLFALSLGVQTLVHEKLEEWSMIHPK